MCFPSRLFSLVQQFCTHHETSKKSLFPTFARTRPPDTQISKSVASLLHKFNWRKVALVYSKTETATRDYEAIAKTIEATLVANKIEVTFVDKWSTSYYHGYTENPFSQIVDKSFQRTRSIAPLRSRSSSPFSTCRMCCREIRELLSPQQKTCLFRSLLFVEMKVARSLPFVTRQIPESRLLIPQNVIRILE